MNLIKLAQAIEQEDLENIQNDINTEPIAPIFDSGSEVGNPLEDFENFDPGLEQLQQETQLNADIPEKDRLLSAAQTPLRILANVEDVAGAISFLATDKTNYLTGETIRVNGGQFML